MTNFAAVELTSFNSRKVRLTREMAYRISLYDNSFNSRKVRLTQNIHRIQAGTPIFQFQKGTINTIRAIVTRYRDEEFQFQKGTINTLIAPPVRDNTKLFQFQKGTINTSAASAKGGLSAISIPERYD